MVNRRRRFPRSGTFRPHVAEPLESRRLLAATTPEFIADINDAVESFNPGVGTTVGSTAYFAGRGGYVAGREVYATDGTDAGTRLLAEVTESLGDVDPLSLRNAAGTLFFVAADATGDRELYKSDGTAAGTARVKDVNPGPLSSTPAPLGVVGNTLYFSASDGAHGVELWKTDGTEAGTVLVSDLAPGSASSSPGPALEFNGSLLFSATPTGASADRRLQRLDLSAGTLAPVANSPADPRNLLRVGDAVLFNASLSGTALTRGDLYRTDGQSTTLVKALDYTTSPGVDNTFVYGPTVANGILFFRASLTSAPTGDLWRSDGTAAGTYVVADGVLRSSNALATAGPNGEVLFARTTAATGAEPWLSDGTAAGTRILKDIAPGPVSGVVNGLLFAGLRVDDQTFFTNNVDAASGSLWVTDGTEANTRRLGVFDGNGRSFSIVGAVDGTALFNGSTRSNTGQLFRSDGTDAGTARIEFAGAGNDSSIEPTADGGPVFARVGDAMYFSARDPEHGMELWRVDDATGHSELVHDLNPGAADSNPGGLVVGHDDSLYFEATAPGTGRDLFRLAPGSATPTLLADFIPGSDGSSVEDVVAEGNAIYFSARRYTTHSSKHLWRYTPGAGTAGTLEPVTNDAGTYAFTEPTVVMRAGDFLYFGANARLADHSITDVNFELWRMGVNGGAAQLVKDVNPNPAAGSSAEPLGAIGSTLLFTANNGTTGIELWRTDGTDGGTTLVKDMTPGSTHTEFIDYVPKATAVLNGVMYFEATAFGSSPTYTWRTDGTAAGTFKVGNVSRPGQFTVFGDSVYFMGDSPAGSLASSTIYRTDGTDANGPLEVVSYNPADPTFFYGLQATPEHLYAVSITNTLTGGTLPGSAVLYRTAGVPGDVERLFELEPMPMTRVGFSRQGQLASSDTHLYFPLYSTATGVEPARLAIVDIPPGVTGLFVGGTQWSQSFRTFVQQSSLGDAAAGFSVDPAAAPDELPWTNLNQVSIRFARDTVVGQSNLTVSGVNVASYAVMQFSYDPATFTATWTLATTVGADKLSLTLSGVTDAATGAPLAAPVQLRLNVLPGDVNRSGGVVNAGDVTQVRNRQFTDTATPGTAPNLYTAFHDVNGNGVVNAQDVTLTRNRQFTGLPADEPAGPPLRTATLAERIERKRLIDGLV